MSSRTIPCRCEATQAEREVGDDVVEPGSNL
jgi:hypothetical protein